MSSSTIAPRKRDSAATRQALLDAARELFGAKGYEATSLRDIGEAAGADASLIARYFGNKAALYVATLNAERDANDRQGIPETVPGLARRVIERVDRHGVGPVMQAIVRGDTDSAIRQVAMEYMRTRILAPMTEQARQRGMDQPELRAELLVAMLTGLAHLRAGSDFPNLATASPDEIVAVICTLFDVEIA